MTDLKWNCFWKYYNVLNIRRFEGTNEGRLIRKQSVTNRTAQRYETYCFTVWLLTKFNNVFLSFRVWLSYELDIFFICQHLKKKSRFKTWLDIVSKPYPTLAAIIQFKQTPLTNTFTAHPLPGERERVCVCVFVCLCVFISGKKCTCHQIWLIGQCIWSYRGNFCVMLIAYLVRMVYDFSGI